MCHSGRIDHHDCHHSSTVCVSDGCFVTHGTLLVIQIYNHQNDDASIIMRLTTRPTRTLASKYGLGIFDLCVLQLPCAQSSLKFDQDLEGALCDTFLKRARLACYALLKFRKKKKKIRMNAQNTQTKKMKTRD